MMKMNIVRIPADAQGQKLSEWLANNGYEISAACGGRGVCGKCKVRLISGRFFDIENPSHILAPDGDGNLLSCHAICSGEDAEITLLDTSGSGLTEFQQVEAQSSESGYGAALDVGTTTLAMALVDRSSGKVIAAKSRLNPQRSFGADVISRISACKEGKLSQLHQAIHNAAAEMLQEFAQEYPQMKPTAMTVTGNTTMLHLFCNESPESMGAYPFTPLFTEERVLAGAETEEVIVMPSASAFIGSDITAGVHACGMLALDEPSVLIDFGTNGEMVLCTGAKKGSRLYCASAAAGPALEGANISCGIGGIAGAVSRVNQDMSYQTIGDQPAIGICGCGLVDMVAALLEEEILDETGRLDDDDYTLSGVHLSADGKKLKDAEPTKIILTQQDIREFQLAKSAMRAGFEALADYAGVPVEKIQHVFIAGGLGYYMTIESAVRVGMISDELQGEIKTVGNSSLAGAIAGLISPQAREQVRHIASHCETVELNTSKVFNEAYIEHMLFPEGEW